MSSGSPTAGTALEQNRYYSLDTLTVTAAVRRLAPRLGGRLLEVGCGDAPYRELVAPHIRKYVGCDIDLGRSRPDVVADGARLPFRERTFDSVLSTQVLEHGPEPLAVLNEIARILQPGGVALVTVPLNAGVHMAPHDYLRFTEWSASSRGAGGTGGRGSRREGRAHRECRPGRPARLRGRSDAAATPMGGRGPKGSFAFLVSPSSGPVCSSIVFPRKGSPLGYALVLTKPREGEAAR